MKQFTRAESYTLKFIQAKSLPGYALLTTSFPAFGHSLTGCPCHHI